MPTCFVVQPFDKGPYDRRYKDLLEPAIRDAGLTPYRVDEDPSVVIPIDDIENRIRESEICLADVTTNNPNIWYEVGFAIANDKPVVFICLDPRPEPYPFDVRHRHVICVYSLRRDDAAQDQGVDEAVRVHSDGEHTRPGWPEAEGHDRVLRRVGIQLQRKLHSVQIDRQGA